MIFAYQNMQLLYGRFGRVPRWDARQAPGSRYGAFLGG